MPALGRSTASDPHLASYQLQGTQALYLQTSPEFFMKRLLAEGSGCIYSLGKAFRVAEVGHRHNPEFTMLEWYRVGYDLSDLMADVRALILQILGKQSFESISYAELFNEHLGICPHKASSEELMHMALDQTSFSGHLTRIEALDLLMSEVIEPNLKGKAVFVFNFPKEQAAMSQLLNDEQGNQVSGRFELFIDGIEIANGYAELNNSAEQRARFIADNHARSEQGLPEIPLDEKFLKALDKMPECSGVALGVDRLFWLYAKQQSLLLQDAPLSDALLFSWSDL